ncbi:MAG: RNA polymerase sigma factor [Flavobacteriaceae bacterium]
MKTQDSFHHLTDEELVEEIIKTKNDILFGILYERFSHIVYNKCYGFTKTKAEAQDLAQDVFVKLYQKLKTFKGRSKFSTWMYSFTYNMCVDYVNKHVLKTVSSEYLELEDLNHLQIETEDYSLFQLREDTLKKALEIITPEDKMMLLLKYQDDFSIKDIMMVLEISESAVKMRLKRAKARIIEAYNNLT